MGASAIEMLMSRSRDLLDTSPGQGRHPELRLVLGIFEPLSYPCASSLFDQRQVDGRADIGLLFYAFLSIAAAAACDFAKDSLPRFPQPVCSPRRCIFEIGHQVSTSAGTFTNACWPRDG